MGTGRNMMTMQDYLDRAPKSVQAYIGDSRFRKANGDFSVGKSSYRAIRLIGKFVKNQVPFNSRDAFIKDFVYKNPNAFWDLYSKSKRPDYRYK
tara:strand:- start:135 stop:416 length:282 start_codon:yes stop_codon:yes gene_type:complete